MKLDFTNFNNLRIKIPNFWSGTCSNLKLSEFIQNIKTCKPRNLHQNLKKIAQLWNENSERLILKMEQSETLTVCKQFLSFQIHKGLLKSRQIPNFSALTADGQSTSAFLPWQALE